MTIDLRVPLLVLALAGLGVSLRLALRPLAEIGLGNRAAETRSGHDAEAPPPVASESIAAVVTRDPFRITRRPLFPPYDPLRIAEQQAPLPPRPTLALVGLIAGRQPSAVIEGLPGVEGARVVHAGDLIGGLTIKKIAGGRVVITGIDTTWTLEVREPWKN